MNLKPGEPIKITLLDGKERTLLFTHRTLRVDVKERVGINVITGEGLDKLDLAKLDELLWLGLRHEDPELTLEQVEDICDSSMNLELGMLLVACLTGQKVADLMKAADQKKAQMLAAPLNLGTGTDTGPSDDST